MKGNVTRQDSVSADIFNEWKATHQGKVNIGGGCSTWSGILRLVLQGLHPNNSCSDIFLPKYSETDDVGKIGKVG